MFDHLLAYQQTDEFRQTAVAHQAKQNERHRSANRRGAEKYRKEHPDWVKMRSDAQMFKSSLFAAQQGRCFYCECVLGSTYHVDHKTPLAKGGTNAIKNLCVCCSTCNLHKGTLSASAFKRICAVKNNYRNIQSDKPTAQPKQQVLPLFEGLRS